MGIQDDVRERVERLELPWNRHGFDPYGTSKKQLQNVFTMWGAAYRHYFSVHTHGLKNVPTKGRVMLIGNHSGGVALDASMVLTSLILELEPPRLAHAMAEKFIGVLPFASQGMTRGGQFPGVPEIAKRLLQEERMLLVFPEGSRGTAKLFRERYSLVDFGTGFMRLALETQTPIVPFAFLGGGEAIPTVYNAYKLGRLLGAPYVPVTPYLLPVPLPVRMDIVYGEPLVFQGNGTEEDEVVVAYVGRVKQRIAELTQEGLRMRGDLAAPREKRT